MLLTRFASGAHSYCEYGKWRSRGPELPSAWEYMWAALSPSHKYRDLVIQFVGETKGSQHLPLQEHRSRTLENRRPRPDSELLHSKRKI
jgi:hypothetical protein